MPDDEPARSKLADQRGNSRKCEIDADPRRISMQFDDDQWSKHRRQHSADRAAGLLQEHRHDGDQHFRQVARFPFEPAVPTRRAGSVNGARQTRPSSVAGDGPTQGLRARVALVLCRGPMSVPIQHVFCRAGMASDDRADAAETGCASAPGPGTMAATGHR